MEYKIEDYLKLDGKIVCLDISIRKIGFAISDNEKKIAFPLKSIKNNNFEAKKYIDELKKENNIICFVIGLPTSIFGEETIDSKRVKSLVHDIRHLLKPAFLFINENMSTIEAKKFMKGTHWSQKKEKLDSVAASIILSRALNDYSY